MTEQELFKLDMGGKCYPLTTEKINELLKDNKIGNYALGYHNELFGFTLHYLGRSDTNLRQRLIQHISDAKVGKEPKYTHFMACYTANVEDAYRKECNNYHNFGGDKGLLDNERHPKRPYGYDKYDISCPYPGCDE